MASLPSPLHGRRRSSFIRLCLIALTQALLGAAIAFTVRDIVDRISAIDGTAGIDSTAGFVLLALVGLALAWLRQRERIEAERIGQGYVHAVRLRLYDRLSSLTSRDLQWQSRGGHLLRFIGDLTALRQWVSLGIARLGVATIATSVSLTALALINIRLASALALVLIVGGGTALTLGLRLRRVARISRRQRSRLAADISERIALMPVVQMFSQIRRERGRIRRSSRFYRRHCRRQRFRQIDTAVPGCQADRARRRSADNRRTRHPRLQWCIDPRCHWGSQPRFAADARHCLPQPVLPPPWCQ